MTCEQCFSRLAFLPFCKKNKPKSCTPTNMTGKITILVQDWYWKHAAPPTADWRELLPPSFFIISARKGKIEGRLGEGFFPKVSTSLLVKLSATQEQGEGSNIEITGYGSNWDRHRTACICFPGKEKNSIVQSPCLLSIWAIWLSLPFFKD